MIGLSGVKFFLVLLVIFIVYFVALLGLGIGIKNAGIDQSEPVRQERIIIQ